MAGTPAIIPIDQVIRSACLDVQDYQLIKYERFLNFALDYVREWNIDSMPSVKTVVKKIGEEEGGIPTIKMPQDMVNWTKIGTKEGDRIKVFTVNEDIALHFDCDDDGKKQPNDKYKPLYSYGYETDDLLDNDGYWFYGGFGSNYSSFSGSIFGYGNGAQGDGQYKPDYKNRRFVFSTRWNGESVLLEYVTTGIEPCGSTVIDERASQALKTYILWQDAMTKGIDPAWRVEMLKRNHFTYHRLAQKRVLSISPDDVLAIHWKRLKQTDKF